MAKDTSRWSAGNTDLLETSRLLEAEGYIAQLGAWEGGAIRCFACHTDSDAGEFRLDQLIRLDGASDPDDMAAVAALQCPNCEQLGILILKFGPSSTQDEDEVYHHLQQIR